MSIKTRKEYLSKVKTRYLKAGLKEKSSMLAEFTTNTGYHPKYAIQLLAAGHSYKAPTINRKVHYVYANSDIDWLRRIWKIMDYPCGQRLAPQLPEIIDKLVRCKELLIPPPVQEKLKYIAPSTIDERLKPAKQKERLKINSTTKPGSLLKNKFPSERRAGMKNISALPS